MRNFTTPIAVHTLASAQALRSAVMGSSQSHGLYVGLDVHKDTRAVATALPGRGGVT